MEGSDWNASEKYSGSIVQVDRGQSEWEMWLESTSHVNLESGWAVGVRTVQSLLVLEHPLLHMDFITVKTGFVAMERHSKYMQEERALVVPLLLMILLCCFIFKARTG